MELTESEFVIPPNVVYFNSAGHCVLPISSQSPGINGILCQSSPWNGYGDEDSIAEDVRGFFNDLINGESSKCIATCHSTSLAISTAAFNVLRMGKLQKSSKILILGKDMASAVLPWQNACDQTGALICIVEQDITDTSQLEPVSWTSLILTAIDVHQHDLAVVCLPNVHWCDGSIIDLEIISNRLAKFPEASRPLLIVDGTQSVGALCFDVQKIRPDFVACSIHKWLNGPFGMSLTYLNPKYHRSWTAIDHHERNRVGSDQPPWDSLGAMISAGPGPVGYPTEYFASARCIESGGHSNPITLAMIRNSLGLILKWGVSNIQTYCREISNKISHGMRSLPPHIRELFVILPDHLRCSHILGIHFGSKWQNLCPNSGSMDILTIGQALTTALKKHGVYIVMRGGCIRVSVYLFNTSQHVDRFINLFQLCVEEYLESLQAAVLPPPLPLMPAPSLAPSVPKPYTILITGASGWLGQFLWSELTECINKFPIPACLFAAYNKQSLDWVLEDQRVAMNLENIDNVREIISRLRPDCVVHLAAISSPVACESNIGKSLAVNCCQVLVDTVKEINPNCLFVFTSTDLVYDGWNPPYECPSLYPSQDSIPLNAYGTSKLAMEKKVLELGNGCVLRLSNMIGPFFKYRSTGTKFLQFLCSSYQKKDKIGLKDDEKRSFVFVRDVSNVIISLARYHAATGKLVLPPNRPAGHGVVFNMGGPEGLSRLELAKIMCSVLKCKLLIEGEGSLVVPNRIIDRILEEAESSIDVFDPISSAAHSIETELENEGESWLVQRQSAAATLPQAGAVVNPLDVTMNSIAISCLLNIPLTRMRDAIAVSLAESQLNA